MKKKLFSKHIAYGVAFALALTGSLSLLTPDRSLSGLGKKTMFLKNSDSYIVAEAEESPVTESTSEETTSAETASTETTSTATTSETPSTGSSSLETPSTETGSTGIAETGNEENTDTSPLDNEADNNSEIAEDEESDYEYIPPEVVYETLDCSLSTEDFIVENNAITDLSEKGIEKIKALKPDNTKTKITEKTVNLTFPEIAGVTAIGDEAFSNAKPAFNSLETVYFNLQLPDNIEKIGKMAFPGGYQNFETIKSIVLGSGTKTICERAFYDHENLISIRLNDGLETIEYQAFYYCNISTINLPDSLKNLGKESFSHAKLEKLTIPANITHIPEKAFTYNRNLKEVTFNEGLKVIGTSAFQACRIEKTFVPSKDSEMSEFPNSLEELGENAFKWNELKAVRIPNTIKIIRGRVFQENQITDIDLGTFEKMEPNPKGDTDSLGAGARRWKKRSSWETEEDPHLVGRMIPFAMFYQNKIKSVKFPEGTWAVGELAFAENEIESLEIPSTVKNIFKEAFSKNPKLTSLKFLKDADGNGIFQIDYGAFYECAIEGELIFPKSINEIGGLVFAYNKLTGVDFGSASPLIGNASFRSNPLVYVKNINSWGFEPDPFSGGHKLKNVSFDYSAPRDSNRGTFGTTEDNTISTSAFSSGSLKSINIPEYIKLIDVINSEGKYISAYAFYDNPGWADNTNKVALYRIDADGKTYVTDNAVDDSRAEDYVFNPVLVKFELKDQYGNALPITSLKVQKTRTITSGSSITDTTTDSALVADYEHFKLGDKIRFTIPSAPNGYSLAENPVTQDWLNAGKVEGMENTYEITLDATNSNVVQDAMYGDGYDVGYKQTVISFNYINKVTSSSGGDGYTNFTPTPETPATSITTPVTDTIKNDEPSIEDTEVDEDVTPRGNTKIVKKVVADKPDKEVAVDDEKSPLGTLPRTGGTNENIFLILGAIFISLGLVLRKKLR